MTKYFIIATILVLGIAIIAAAWWARQPRATLRIASVSTTMHPRNEAPQNTTFAGSNVSVSVTAPWVLSALPTCVQQTKVVRGSEQFVRARIPEDAQPVRTPIVLHYGDCAIEIQSDSALILRGHDRLQIPPLAHFFQNTHAELFVLHEGEEGTQLRVYAPSRLR